MRDEMKIEVEVIRTNRASKYIECYEFSDYESAKQIVDLFNKSSLNATAKINELNQKFDNMVENLEKKQQKSDLVQK